MGIFNREIDENKMHDKQVKKDIKATKKQLKVEKQNFNYWDHVFDKECAQGYAYNSFRRTEEAKVEVEKCEKLLNRLVTENKTLAEIEQIDKENAEKKAMQEKAKEVAQAEKQSDAFVEVKPSDYINDMMEKGSKIEEYQKFAKVSAVQGKVGQEVVTVMANGLEETKNAVKIDEKTGEPGWIITNPSGEQYIVPDSKFKARYDVENSKDGIYESIYAPIKAIEISDNISFKAPWGEQMNIAKGGFLVVNSPDDIYGIQKDEFYETYKSLEEYKKDKQKENDKAKAQTKEQEQEAEAGIEKEKSK